MLVKVLPPLCKNLILCFPVITLASYLSPGIRLATASPSTDIFTGLLFPIRRRSYSLSSSNTTATSLDSEGSWLLLENKDMGLILRQ